MSFSSPGGWLERTKRTREKQAARADMADIRVQRAQLAVHQAERDAAEMARFEAENRAAKLACPCCRGEGRVTAEMAELVYRALERLPRDSKPDAMVLANLARIARGEAVHTHGPKVSLGLAHPSPVASAETATTTPSQIKKPINSNSFTDDGALIELGD
ncbi:hypothetical protein LNAOJCKE_1588 [Methylorubrum aminovorans]|uniref:Terminase small subunit n=1 Tax=Methylorubrum aminovorans TaxID=269069 RepID=A0ABQ4UBI2_9HYPH|nr:hypothetical protein [Methylorubrum aminovorans]GJE64384.1 hypothetical protein LNAOJCKE_1588 [Methylorubrum aminovorans]GMA76187.1 hypothetical protein GCM10025880_26040 [Methylorubrum aminovorans]